MPDESALTSEKFKAFNGAYFDRLVKGTAQVYGGKAVDAVKLSPDEELALWLKPTSPAAQKAYELGGTDEDAQHANELWAHAMKGQQQMLTQQAQQQGATPDQVFQVLKQNGLTDEMIAATCRKHAYNLGKANSHNDPAEEAAYHKRMAEKSAAKSAPPKIEDVTPGQEAGSHDVLR